MGSFIGPMPVPTFRATETVSGVLDLVIVGAGPAGLAAAIAAKQAGFAYLVLDKGTIVNSILNFPSYMVFFTTPELLEIGGLPFTSPHGRPTRLEALCYYRRVVDTLELAVSLNEEVVGIRHEVIVDTEETAFAIGTRSGSGAERRLRARAVIFATGYYDHPNLKSARRGFATRIPLLQGTTSVFSPVGHSGGRSQLGR
jgi:thioredoxin reductase (NADPH)